MTPSGCLADTGGNATFLPGVAINAEHSRLFTAGSDGRLIAINRDDGSTVWHSQEPLEALGLSDGAVVARVTMSDCPNCLQLVWLSSDDGMEQRRSQTMSLPDWVAVAPAPGMQFAASIQKNGSSLFLHWQANRRYAGGARPTEQILADSKRDATGTFLIDVDGNAKDVTRTIPAPPSIPPPLRNVASATYWNCSEWRDIPVVDSDGMVAFDLAARPDGQTLSARRWRLPSSELVATRQLTQGSHLELQTSPDMQYLFVHDGRVETDARASAGWEVFSLRTLNLVASIPYSAGQACANVAADVIVVLSTTNAKPNQGGGRTRELAGYSIKSGEPLWSVRLRDAPEQLQRR